MCGIGGLVGEFVPGLAGRMNAIQAHRGPDGHRVFEDADAEVALAHRRLAILDLSDRAAQPMHSRDGRYVLSLNGEIYNFKDLRQELEGKGVSFRTTSDSEVLLEGLALHGEAFVERLNGMFTFALWDRGRRELLLARDPIGVKPLYYTVLPNGALLFASEIKALHAYPGLRREVDFSALQQHLSMGYSSGNRTALEGVRRLAPGTTLRWSSAGREPVTRQYSRFVFEGFDGRSRDEAVDRLRTLLAEAVRRQMVSDVPVGAFLSGGLDSSLLTAFACRDREADFDCYTITYPPEDNLVDGFDDDAPYARQVAGQLGAHLREIEIKPEVATLWPQLLWHLDEPIADPAAIACYLISKLARENGTPVLLSGQGADELFAGYPRYSALQATRALDAIPRPLRSPLARVGRSLPGSRENRSGRFLRRARRVLAEVDQGVERRFLAYCTNTADADLRRVLSRDFRAEVGDERPTDACFARLQSGGLEGMNRFLERDLAVYLPNHNLLYTDKMGMAVGLEARVPLLDLELVDSVLPYPANWKIRGTTTKAILRDAARGLVPDEVISRPKTGFGAPYRSWLRHDLAEMWHDLTSPEVVRGRGWFDAEELRRARQRSQTGKADLYMLQWAVLTAELWARSFLDRDPGQLHTTQRRDT